MTDTEPIRPPIDEQIRNPWHDRAACRNTPDVDFFPGPHTDISPARAVCASCPVRDACLDYALSHPMAAGQPLQGIWAGTSMKDRRKLRRARATT